MTKFKALITALILGSSSVAMAEPVVTFDGKVSWGTRPVRPAHDTGFARGTWISLAEPMQLERGRNVIRLDDRVPVNQIRLQSATGASYISDVTLQFADGSRQSITINRWINRRNPTFQFNLTRPARIDKMVVRGSTTARGGSYQVFGYGNAQYSRSAPPPVYQPEPVHRPPVYTQQTVPLANGATLAWSRGSKEFAVGPNMGNFRSLRLTGVTGDTLLSHLLVSFTNGHEQMIPVKRTLKGGETIQLNLDAAGRGSVARVVVFQTDSTDVIGPSAGTFNLAAQ